MITRKKTDKPTNWNHVVKLALQQEAIVKSVFCARCVWIIGKLATKNSSRVKVLARQHYIQHMHQMLMTMASEDKKIVKFKIKKR